MGERTVVLLGSLYDYEKARAIDPMFLQDLKNIGLLSHDQLGIVLESLKQADSYDTAEFIIKSKFEANIAASVLRLVILFASVDTGDFFDRLIELRASSDVVSKEFSEHEWEKVQERCRQFVPIRCIAKHIKCEGLQTVTGNQFHDVDIICDIRPVFNDARDVIEDLIPVTTLKLRYFTQAEEIKVLEVVLSEEDIDYLKEKIRMTKRKLDVMQQFFSPK